MSTYAFPGVRAQGQLGLLSCLRRYDGACAFSLPRLVALLQDKNIESPGHDQRVIGATTMLSTGYAQGRIMRDWAMIRQFLLSVSQSGHHEKDEVLDALDSLFNTFLGSWYQVSLAIPEYTKWNYPPGLAVECKGFKGYSELIETLADLVTSNPNMHWSVTSISYVPWRKPYDIFLNPAPYTLLQNTTPIPQSQALKITPQSQKPLMLPST